MTATRSTFIESTTHAPLIRELRDTLRAKSAGCSDDDFVLRGLWRVDYRYRPNRWERDLAYTMIYGQTIWQGCCYVDYQAAVIDDSYLGQDSRELVPTDPATEVAVLDAAYAVIDKTPAVVHTFEGSAESKAVERARIVVDEVQHLLGGDVRDARILQVGVMGNFVRQLVDRGAAVVGSDFDQKLIGRTFNDAPMRDGVNTLDMIAEADVVLATGMTLSTGTLGDIIEATKRHGAKLVLFAATGAHFAEEYCRSFGVDVVLSELQPQYMFQGTSTINIYRGTT
jgi:hypothetical protein